jgi:hypothetical protein
MLNANQLKSHGYKGYWYSKDEKLYSSNTKRKDGKFLICRTSLSKSGKIQYKIKGKRFTLEQLNKLCYNK